MNFAYPGQSETQHPIGTLSKHCLFFRMLIQRDAMNLREIGKFTVLNLREIGKNTVLNLRGNENYLIFAAEIAFGIMEKRVFKRKVYAKILQWKQESNGETALMIQGARRIGKSTIVEEFA